MQRSAPTAALGYAATGEPERSPMLRNTYLAPMTQLARDQSERERVRCRGRPSHRPLLLCCCCCC